MIKDGVVMKLESKKGQFNVSRYISKRGDYLYDVRAEVQPAVINIKANQYVILGTYTSDEVLTALDTGKGMILGAIEQEEVGIIAKVLPTKFSDLFLEKSGVMAYVIWGEVYFCSARMRNSFDWPLGTVLPISGEIMPHILSDLLQQYQG